VGWCGYKKNSSASVANASNSALQYYHASAAQLPLPNMFIQHQCHSTAAMTGLGQVRDVQLSEERRHAGTSMITSLAFMERSFSRFSDLGTLV
jgi:hypothetical protein